MLSIFIKLLGHALWTPSIYAPSFAPNERPHKFLVDSCFGSNFKDLQKLP